MADNNAHPEDYIATSQIRQFIAGIFRTIFKLLSISGYVLKRMWSWLLVGLAGGALVGVLFHAGAGSNYKVTMVVEYTELNKRTFNDLMGQLQTLVITDSRSILASELKISNAQAQNIRSIEGESFNNDPLLKDTATARQLRIVIGLKQPIKTDSLEAALINYLNNLPYLKVIKQAKARIYEDQLAFVKSEEGKLDTLKNEYVHSLSTFRAPTTVYNNEFNPASIYHESFRLDSLRAATALSLATDTQFVFVISGLKPTENPVRISRSVSIVGFMLIGFVVFFVFLLFGEINKRLNGVV